MYIYIYIYGSDILIGHRGGAAARVLPRPPSYRALPEPSGPFRTLPDQLHVIAVIDQLMVDNNHTGPPLFAWLKINKQWQTNNNYVFMYSYLFSYCDSLTVRWDSTTSCPFERDLCFEIPIDSY